jgi:hypothetical protein
MTGILTKKTNAGNSVNQQSSQSPNGITATPVSFLAGRVKNILLENLRIFILQILFQLN